ncbi:uncharacterized protein V1516DRAFT_642678 [Lipomyces oligophaga]|uniref:uncharacterized protein n=1 Tax=Lipomyces oligophaga TaxID=45792 RepID=UPI0034CE48CC
MLFTGLLNCKHKSSVFSCSIFSFKLSRIFIRHVWCETSIPYRSQSTWMKFPIEQLSELRLDEKEQQICEFLVAASAEIDKNDPERSENLVLRLTGGWVRDKLLGLPSSDLDVAVNRMTGYNFGVALSEFSEHEEKFSNAMQGLHKIAMNPDSSKHLETTTTMIYGIDVDLVNLRSEEYTESSRIPIMRFGTPEEDALRRDATLNALFYNLQTSQVEDFTGRGLDDLKSGILRTPLEPFKTFQDDPLRALRLIRFASRYNFQIEKSAFDSLSLPEIKIALIEKISRERVGTELYKILTGPDPVLGLSLIHNSGLEDAIFCLPPQTVVLEAKPEPSRLNTLIYFVDDLLRRKNVPILSTEITADHKEIALIYLFASLSHLAGVTLGSGKPSVASFRVVRDSIKLSTSIATATSDLVTKSPHVLSFVSANEWLRKDAGLLIRSCGERWRQTLFCALVLDLYENKASLGEAQIIGKYESFIHFIELNKLENSWNIKPLINGKQICSLLKIKPGAWMKSFLETVIEWQLENPEANAADCEKFVLSCQDLLVKSKFS